ALAPHGIDQSLPMERRANDARGHFERRQFGGIDRAKRPPAGEPDDADVFAVDEHRHDRLRLRADALEHAATRLLARSFLDDAHGPPGAKLGALAREIPLVD